MFTIYKEILLRQYKKRMENILNTVNQDMISTTINTETNKFTRRISKTLLISWLFGFILILFMFTTDDNVFGQVSRFIFLADITIDYFFIDRRHSTVNFYRSYTDQYGDKE